MMEEVEDPRTCPLCGGSKPNPTARRCRSCAREEDRQVDLLLGLQGDRSFLLTVQEAGGGSAYAGIVGVSRQAVSARVRRAKARVREAEEILEKVLRKMEEKTVGS